MKLRFQTRLTIAIALVAAVSVLVLSVVLLAVDIGLINAFFATRGMVLTKLVMRSVKQNMQLPETVMRRVGEQMTVSALLTAELTAEAEKNHNAPEAVSTMLRNVIERILVLSDHEPIGLEDMPERVRVGRVETSSIQQQVLRREKSLTDAVDEFERDIIRAALEHVEFNQTRAADLLGTTRRILKYRMDKLGIQADD